MEKKPYKILTIIVMLIYSILIFSSLSLRLGNWFVETDNEGIIVNSEKMEGESFSDYSKRVTNFIPFKTMKNYINKTQKGELAAVYTLEFFVLNLIAAFPFGLLLPVAFKKLRVFWNTFSALLAIGIIKELFKLFMTVGRCDIDAVILNVIGGIVGYLIFMLIYKNPSIREEITD